MQNDEQIKGSQPSKKIKKDPINQLQQLKQYSLVVADTGNFNLIEKYKPQDSTTNPTLILQATEHNQFKSFLDQSLKFTIQNYQAYMKPKSKIRSKKSIDNNNKIIQWINLNQDEKNNFIDLSFDHLSTTFGIKILDKINGFVSTQVDAKLSFNTTETIARANRIMAIYKQRGIQANRILIKIASTWQGIKAAESLYRYKIKCNMTLIFNQVQAIACAERKLFLISPFVGRIYDWYKKQTGTTQYDSNSDPGVLSVKEIYNYFKKYHYKTQVMGASFRNIGQIKQLCGCDRLTISPKLLQQLSQNYDNVPEKLSAIESQKMQIQKININEIQFRYQMNQNKMSNDLLSQGIRKFIIDGQKVKEILKKRANQLYNNKFQQQQQQKQQINNINKKQQQQQNNQFKNQSILQK